MSKYQIHSNTTLRSIEWAEKNLLDLSVVETEILSPSGTVVTKVDTEEVSVDNVLT